MTMNKSLLILSILSVFALSAVAQVEEPGPGELEPAVSFDSESAEAAAQDAASLPAEPASEMEAPAPSITRNETRTGFDTMDHLDLDATSVTGNRELPKVLYIVPWKNSDLGDLRGRPVNSLVDEVLSPVDRDVFRRHLQYYSDIKVSGDQPPPGE